METCALDNSVNFRQPDKFRDTNKIEVKNLEKQMMRKYIDMVDEIELISKSSRDKSAEYILPALIDRVQQFNTALETNFRLGALTEGEYKTLAGTSRLLEARLRHKKEEKEIENTIYNRAIAVAILDGRIEC